jgi:LmbE family N-acetylglucosaminyl deacetylase
MRGRILAIFAHPDDETFLAGGALAKHAASGWDVFVLCATHGEAGRRGDYEHLTPKEFARLRKAELEAACRALGVHAPLLLECADRALARDCWHSATEEVVRIIRRLRPQVVITFGPDGISGHPDHVALSQIVSAAFRGAGAESSLPQGTGEPPPFQPRALYCVLKSAAVPPCCTAAGTAEPPPPTTVINVGEFGRRKLEAVRCYRSQKHLQPEDPAAIAAILAGSENFHRAFPAWEGGRMENEFFSG